MSSEPSDLTSSCEQVSRFLRRKTSDIGSLLEFATKLVDNEFPGLVFPLKELFLMDWWFDRADVCHETPEFWRFFKRIWQSLDHEVQVQIYKRHNFLNVISVTMKYLLTDSLADEVRIDLLTYMFESIQCVVESKIYLRTSVECMSAIVVNYLELVLRANEAGEEGWSALIFKIYDGTLYGVSNYKKVAAKFTPEGLSASMSLLAVVNSTSKFYARLCDVIRDLTFSPSIVKDHDTDQFKHFFTSLTFSNTPDLTDAANLQVLCQILRLGLDKLSKTRQKSLMPRLCEQILTVAPGSVRMVLAEVVEKQLVISTDVLKPYLVTENVDWDLASEVCEYDFDIVLVCIEKLFATCAARVHDNSRTFLKAVVDGFAKIRDLQQFMRLWSSNVTSQSAFTSPELIDHVSKVIATSWTLTQIMAKISEIHSAHDGKWMAAETVCLLALTQALGFKGDALLPDQVELMVSICPTESSCDKEAEAYVSKLRYFILSIGSDVVKKYVQVNDEDVRLSNNFTKCGFYDAQTVFRLEEISKAANFVDTVKTVTVKTIKLSSSKPAKLVGIFNSGFKKREYSCVTGSKDGLALLILRIIDRWLVLFE
ncbi:hypothetical protein V1512DRAFT_212348 [Lipomyces arxii]|uniref:uncharacterized protein n=1 Tax=Lipomyces arxii TaxID=56418 RepID=UPI0034CE46E8